MTDYRLLREVGSYQQAERIVDALSDDGFPVENLRIIGTDLETIEDIRGRKTNATAAGAGALSGVWFGFFIGLMFWIIAPGAGLLVTFGWPILFGAVFGAVFGLVAHAATRGRRDFTSIKGLRSNAYEVQVRAEHLSEAHSRLSGLGLNTSDEKTVY